MTSYFAPFVGDTRSYFCKHYYLCIAAVDFHPSGDLLLVAGEDKHMRFFKIDGEKNEKQLSVRLNDMSIQQAAFRRTGGASVGSSNNSTEVLACGRKPFFYSYDTESGNVAKIPGMYTSLFN